MPVGREANAVLRARDPRTALSPKTILEAVEGRDYPWMYGMQGTRYSRVEKDRYAWSRPVPILSGSVAQRNPRDAVAADSADNEKAGGRAPPPHVQALARGARGQKL
jgi:hypothetical protein